MAHHKRKRPKHQRAGCLVCKPWKDERVPKYGKQSGGFRERAKRGTPKLRADVAERLANDG